ncbi:probable serine/threonine-protein kinase PIX13 [Vigna radiata var. radiata]|uniref:Probable serine/threonine-protein kinase PIX13 n=1 Tax=Vigna radiata var. radiata TaxID=3916 RepID=A0A1S3UJJ3_VIGRR|nr:probable serine/threonine-protein kinase PIX13 [Vigna radiata var. radiata]
MGLCFSSAPTLRYSSLNNPHYPFPGGQILKWPELKVFSFKELKSATRNFKSNRSVGKGRFGLVYKGWLDEKTLTPVKPGSGVGVAIKMFKTKETRGFLLWQFEINVLGRLSHPNVVRLLGYCRNENEFLLVHEFMPKGSLKCHLFEKNHDMEPLSWNTRLKIVIGAARGLAFLHANENKVMFRDFSTSNILLDGNYNAKIAYFWLGEGRPAEEQSHATRSFTDGYYAPEYNTTGQLYVESHVHGFGAVFLEILTGMRTLDIRRAPRQRNLVDWTKTCLSSKKKWKNIIDDRIKDQISPKAALESAQLALKCLEDNRKQRPSMKEVLEGLEAIQDIH